MEDKENVLCAIPGDLVGTPTLGFPPAETCKGEFREVIVDVPGHFRAKIRYEPQYFKRGKMSRWFWLPKSAERLE